MRRPLIVIASVLCAVALTAARTKQGTSPMFALLITTGPAWDTSRAPGEQRHFSTHSANLRRLRDAGVVVAGGRFGAYGLIIVRAPTRDSAAAMLKPDSAVAVGTFRVQIDAWSTIYEGVIAR